MPQKNQLEFANFHCTFGRQDMDEYLAEIVLPALLKGGAPPSRRSTARFYETALIDDGDSADAAVAVRLVRGSTIKGEKQLTSAGELVDAKQRIDLAGSAMLVLVLANHRLAYYPETTWAPSLDQFKSACLRALNHQRTAYVRSLLPANLDAAQRAEALKQLNEKIQPPSLEIIPIAGDQELHERMARYQRLQEVEVRFIRTNGELNSDSLFEQAGMAHVDSGADRTSITHVNNKDGLKKDVVEAEVKGAVKQGTVEVKLRGLDADGGILRTTNNDVRFKVPFSTQDTQVTGVGKQMVETMDSQLREKKLGKPNFIADVRDKIRSGVQRFRRDGE